jgi:polysaccharide biosynthesis protein PslH
LSVKKALLVLPEPPLPFGGAAARWYHSLLKGFSERDIHATVLTCTGSKDRDEEAQELHGLKHELHFFRPLQRNLLSAGRSLLKPFSYPFSAEMRKRLYCLPHESFDLIQFETHFTGWLMDRPIPGAVVDVLNLYCIDWQADRTTIWKTRIFRSLVLMAERKLLRRFSRFSALSDRLAKRITEINPRATGAITPLTLDPDLYTYDLDPQSKQPAVFTVGLIGSFNWFPTSSAGRKLKDEIWPQLKKQLPNAKLLIVGRAAHSLFPTDSEDASVEIHSDVDDTLPYFRRIDVMVYLPSIGSGMKIKVLEAIALGIVVITNEDGVEGLPEAIAKLIRVDSTDHAIQRVIEISRDIGKFRKIAVEARNEFVNTLSIANCIDRTLLLNKKGFLK